MLGGSGGLVAVDNDADRCSICAAIVEIRVSHLYGVQKQDTQGWHIWADELWYDGSSF